MLLLIFGHRRHETWACRPFSPPRPRKCAWTVRIGATGLEAAGVIHTDFQRGFIRAEVIGYDDYIAGRGERWNMRSVA